MVAFGLHVFYLHEATAGDRGSQLAQWPTASTLPRAANVATLIMFLHPSCPCSRASVAELSSLVASTRTHARIFVVFVADEAGGSLWDAVGRIAGAERLLDRDGVEAARFGARTSGHVEIFDARGQPAYAGGITGSRGHVGENTGKQSVISVLEGLAPINAHYSVFGCGLVAPGDRP